MTNGDAPVPRAEQARRTRARILAVALRLFADKGYDATSLQDIADEMGLTKPAVYYHYKGKGEILRDLAAPARTATAEILARAMALPLGPERVDIIVEGLTELFIARRDMSRIVSQQPALREDMHAALGGQQRLDVLIEALYGPEPSLDQRFAIYSGIAVGNAIWALREVPEDELRGVLRRAFRRVAAVR